MARRLGDNLTTQKRLLLGQLTMMPGWLVLKELMEEECLEATKDILKLKADSEKYAESLMRLHLKAQSENEFAASILRSAELQVKQGAHENERQETVKTLVHQDE